MPVTREGDSWTVDFHQHVQYGVHFVDDYFIDGDPALILGGCPPGRRAVVIDRNVYNRYWHAISRYFEAHSIDPVVIILDVSEEGKSAETLVDLLRRLKALRLMRRSEPIIAIGGGILTDIVGLAAHLLARGTPWVRVVTSLQMVDAGTSVKTAVNFNGKSGIGGFWPPIATIIDRRFLRTLPPIHFVETSSEIVKVGLIMNRPLVDEMERTGTLLISEQYQGLSPESDRAARFVFTEAVTGSLEDNADNIRELDLFRRMHFGHTWSPTWETEAVKAGHILLHGFAVSIDMALTAVLSHSYGLLDDEELTRVITLLRTLGLPTHHEYLGNADMLRRATESAIVARDGELRLTLLDGIGGCRFKSDIEFAEIESAARSSWLAA